MALKRIEAIASLVPNDAFVLDIGTDHAYLPIYLIKNNIAKYVYASDVAEGAINQAISNINKYGLNDKIKPFLTDGIKNIPRDYDVITISGMGTETIKQILNNNLFLDTYIIQSNNDLYALRKFFNKNGYKIEKEIIIHEGKIYYSIIKFVKGTQKLNNAELHFGISYDKTYLNHLKTKFESIMKTVPEDKNKGLKKDLEYINNLLKKC